MINPLYLQKKLNKKNYKLKFLTNRLYLKKQLFELKMN